MIVPYNALLYLVLVRPVFILEVLSSQIEIKCAKSKIKKKRNSKNRSNFEAKKFCLKNLLVH